MRCTGLLVEVVQFACRCLQVLLLLLSLLAPPIVATHHFLWLQP